MDLFSRKPIGWALSFSPNSQLTGDALKMAFESRGKPKGVMFHSDQGCHYSSQQFRQYLWRFQIKQSMSRRGNCWDTGYMIMKTGNYKLTRAGIDYVSLY
jgi:putative transposase